MARKQIDVTITDDRPLHKDNRPLNAKGKPEGEISPLVGKPIGEVSRDLGKVFRITEMPASKAEKWAIRALLAVARSGIDIPPELMQGGMRALAFVGVRALSGLSFDDAEPLLDEMMECVQIVESKIVRHPTENDIEEVATRVFLRQQVLDLHVGFSKAGAQ